MFPLAVVLGIACYLSDHDVRRYALPLAIAGGAIAFWHSLLFAGVISEAIQPCTQNGPSCSGEDQVLFRIFTASVSLVSGILFDFPLVVLVYEKGTKMNRRHFVAQIGIAVLGLFGFGVYLYQPLVENMSKGGTGCKCCSIGP